jgi:ABC-type multidrug transport system fused ATPase/permease subunit
VSFAYRPGEPALDSVSFSLPKGSCLGILGRTGSGKTTIARLLCRFYDPSSGCIRLDGIDIRELPFEHLRSHVGLVSQEVQLFHASVRDNLTFFDPAVSDAVIREAVDALGLSPWLSRLGDGLATVVSDRGLSAGEAQLVALARIFLRNPGLVVLDEASSRLDPATGQLAERAIDRLLAGRSAIIIAHKPAAIERAGTILVLENGRTLQYGERRHIAADPLSHYVRLAGGTEARE